MNKKVSFGRYAAMAAVLVGAVGTAQAQLVPAGPVWMQGYVSVDLTGIGVGITDFRCKVKALGRTSMASPNVINIEGVQALNNADGQAPSLCATVDMQALPWPLTVTPGATQTTPDLQTYSAAITGISFDSPFVPGDGCQGSIAGTWIENEDAAGAPALGAFTYPSYSRFEAQNVWMGTPEESCFINELLLKVTRPDAPRMP